MLRSGREEAVCLGCIKDEEGASPKGFDIGRLGSWVQVYIMLGDNMKSPVTCEAARAPMEAHLLTLGPS